MKKISKYILMFVLLFAIISLYNKSSVYAGTKENVVSQNTKDLEKILKNTITKKNMKYEVQIEEEKDNTAYYIITYSLEKFHTVLHLDDITIIVTHTRINNATVNQIIEAFSQVIRHYNDDDAFVERILEECNINKDNLQLEYFNLLKMDNINED